MNQVSSLTTVCPLENYITYPGPFEGRAKYVQDSLRQFNIANFDFEEFATSVVFRPMLQCGGKLFPVWQQ